MQKSLYSILSHLPPITSPSTSWRLLSSSPLNLPLSVSLPGLLKPIVHELKPLSGLITAFTLDEANYLPFLCLGPICQAPLEKHGRTKQRGAINFMVTSSTGPQLCLEICFHSLFSPQLLLQTCPLPSKLFLLPNIFLDHQKTIDHLALYFTKIKPICTKRHQLGKPSTSCHLSKQLLGNYLNFLLPSSTQLDNQFYGFYLPNISTIHSHLSISVAYQPRSGHHYLPSGLQPLTGLLASSVSLPTLQR